MPLLLLLLPAAAAAFRLRAPLQEGVRLGAPEYEVEVAFTPDDFRMGLSQHAQPTDHRHNDLLYQVIELQRLMDAPHLFEGDILGITENTIDELVEDLNSLEGGPRALGDLDVARYQAIRDESRRWPGGLVPFTISSLYTVESRAAIARGIHAFHNSTCIRWVPRSSEPDYIFITPMGNTCSSYVGRQGGRQEIRLGPDCLGYLGVILHEFMHSMGFFHEQSREDRDEFIRVNWKNVANVWIANFRKYRLNYITHLGAPYDYSSIMHYGPYAFSRNGRRTLEPVDPIYKDEIGQRVRLSEIDIVKINRLYQCEAVPVTTRRAGIQLITDYPATSTTHIPTDFPPATIPVPLPVDYQTTTRETATTVAPTTSPTLPLSTQTTTPRRPVTEESRRRFTPVPLPKQRIPTDFPPQVEVFLTPTFPAPTDAPTSSPTTSTTPTATTPRTYPTTPSTQPTTTNYVDERESRMKLYHPYECYSRTDNGKLMYWPEKGYPRSHYQCVILPHPNSRRGFEYVLERVNCLWERDGSICEVMSGDARLCWGRFFVQCPQDLPLDMHPLP